MSRASRISLDQVKHITKLANLPLNELLLRQLQGQLESTFEYINKIQSLNTENIEETSQVTGLINIFRKDLIEKDRILTQKQALSGAKSTYKGYFKISAIFDNE